MKKQQPQTLKSLAAQEEREKKALQERIAQLENEINEKNLAINDLQSDVILAAAAKRRAEEENATLRKDVHHYRSNAEHFERAVEKFGFLDAKGRMPQLLKALSLLEFIQGMSK